MSATKEAEEAVKDGKTHWECIRRLQQAHVGRRPCIPRAVRKEDGELTDGSSEVLQCWHQHFSKLLNRQSSGRSNPAVSPYYEFDEPPSMEELELALSQLKQSKAGR